MSSMRAVALSNQHTWRVQPATHISSNVNDLLGCVENRCAPGGSLFFILPENAACLCPDPRYYS